MRKFTPFSGLVISLFITIFFAFSYDLKAQYCDAAGSCDEYISRVQVGIIDNSSACDSYMDYTALSTDMEIGIGYPITVTNGNPYASDQCGIWVDWNQDQDFIDANEAITVTGTPGNGPYTATITPPGGATPGNTRMRIRITYTGTVDPCGTTTYGEVEDYTINVTSSGPMIYVSSTVTQNNTASVSPGDGNQEIIGIEVVTSGSASPLSVTSIRLRTDGSTNPLNDISNAKIWYTGTSSSFATVTQFGATYAAPPATGTDYSISSSQILSSGTNYFWVTYNIQSGANVGNVVDGICNQVTVGGSNQTPTTTNPAGNRPITDNNAIYTCNYTWYDSGGAAGNYSNNEADTVTFCSTNGESIQVTFNSFSTVASEDEIYVYDGPDVFSNLLIVLSGDYLCQVTPFTYIPPRVNSTNDCITFKFVSSGSNTKPGWEAEVECVPFCGNNKMAKDNCGSATPICDLNGYCGNTSGIYTTDKPGNMCDVDDVGCTLFTGRIHNNSWLQFRAKTLSMTMYVDVSDCNLSEGIQFGVYEGDGCDNFILVSDPQYVTGTGPNMPPDQTTTLNITGLVAGQTYYIMVDGNVGDVCNYSITSDDFLTPYAGDDVVICEGDSVQMNAEGGLNYTWTPASTLSNANISNPIAFPTNTTSYVVEFTGTECQVTDTVTVVVYDNPETSITADPDSICIGGTTQLNGNPTPGTGAIVSHLWTGPDAGNLNQTNIVDPVLTATTAGLNNLIYTVTDEYGCSSSSQIKITVFEITTDFEISEILCPYDSVTFTYTGIASSSGTYDWDFTGGTPSSSTGIGPHTIYFPSGGSYTVTLNSVADYGCTSTGSTSQIVNMPDSLYGVAAGTDALCYGDATGSAELIVYGGTPPYTYSWSNSATTEDISGLSIGTYSVIITDNNGCVTNTSVIISQPASTLYAQAPTMDQPDCNGYSDGSITVNPTGGTSPYSFQWDANAGNQTTQMAGNLSAGTYGVTITDVNGCTYNDSYTLPEPAEITLIPGSTDAMCNQATGTASVAASGGTGNFSYNWSTGGTGPSIAGIPAGTYGVTVTDENGCSESASVTVNDEGAPDAYISDSSMVTCFGYNNGSATVSATGGTPPYSYVWPATGGTDATETGLVGGITYTVYVTDSLGCQTSTTVLISQPPALIYTITGMDIDCNDGNSYGSVSLDVSGGTPPYYYIWSNSETTQNIDSIQSGIYYVTISDENGCTQTDSADISVPPQLIIDTLYTIDDYCSQGDGEAAVTMSGGVPPYVILWSDIQSQSNDTAFLLVGGQYYSVSITDANGCLEVFDSIYVGDHSGGEAVISTIEHVGCYGQPTGSLTVGMNGGTAPFTYLWDPNYLTTPTITGLYAGDYWVLVTDANNCKDSTGATITQQALLMANILGENITHVACYGDETGSIEVTMTGGTPDYTYLWPSGGTDAIDENLEAGPYTVTVSDINGCTATASETITQPSTALLIDLIHADTVCYGEGDGYAEVDAYGGTEGSGYSYVWSDPSGQTGITATGLAPGDYTVSVTDANNCTATLTVPITEAPEITFSFDTISTSCNGVHDGEIILAANVVNPPYEYVWSNVETLPHISDLAPGYYTVTITDGSGCTRETIFEVYNSSTPCLVIPTVITPNGDTYNDTWKIEYLRLYDNVTIQVFNRWGEIVFEYTGDGADYEDDVSKHWDGTSAVNGKPLPLGSYIYVIAFNNNEKLDPVQGIITIVRKGG